VQRGEDADEARFSFRATRRSQVRNPPTKIRDILELLKRDGWTEVAVRGSHRQFKRATKPGWVTVPGKPGDDVTPGTLDSIRNQASLKR
jgi:predicted RNA binding protein YcfA (HicA-like mRNA interferase family)